MANDHIVRHKHVQKLYEELLTGVPGVKFHCQPGTGKYDSNFWLCTIGLYSEARVKGQEGTVVEGAVSGAAGVIHRASSTMTDCQPNEKVEALSVFLDATGIEAKSLWRPKQPVYA